MVHRHYLLVSLLVGVLWAVAVALWAPVAWWQVALVASGLVAVIVFAGILQVRQVGAFLLLGALFVGMSLGAWRADAKLSWLKSPQTLVGQELGWSGVVVSEPQASGWGMRAIVKLRDCNLRNLEESVDCANMRVLVALPAYSEIRLRDVIGAECQFARTENFSDDFDYRMYLAKNGVRTTCKVKSFEVLSLDESNNVDKAYAQLMKLRYKMEAHITQSVPQPAAALASGLLFGGDRRLSDDIAEDFRRTGLTHIVAVSGFNVTIIAHFVVLAGILLGLWRASAVWLAIVAVFVFVAMIGFPAPAVRAGIMGLIVLLAMRAGRISSALPAVLAAAAAMVLVNPLILRYDTGFQLSVLATLGLILMYPLFERWFMRRGEMKFVTEIFFMTLSAQIFVVPIIAYYFGTVSVISLLANLLVLPVIPIAMALAFVVSMVGFVSSAAAVIVGTALYWLLAWVFVIVQTFSALSWASKDVTISVELLLVFYLALFATVFILRKKLSGCRCAKQEN